MFSFGLLDKTLSLFKLILDCKDNNKFARFKELMFKKND